MAVATANTIDARCHVHCELRINHSGQPVNELLRRCVEKAIKTNSLFASFSYNFACCLNIHC